MLCRKPFEVKVKTKKAGIDIAENFPVPCGKCFHCRTNQSRIWQTRLMLEALVSFDSAMLTLTYDDIHLPLDGNVCKPTLQKFIKRLRKRFEPHQIRFYGIGEYGDKTWRPHYHIMLFSPVLIERCYMPCEDMRKRDLCTHDCYTQLAWPHGMVDVSQTVGKENTAYITGYLKKKATKPYYEHLDNRKPEFQMASRGRRNHPDPKQRTGGIGYGGIKEIAEKFKNSGHSSSKSIRCLDFGTTSRPIGRYLTDRLQSQLGTSELVRTLELMQYIGELREIYGDPEYHEKIEGKRQSREEKAKIFNRRSM